MGYLLGILFAIAALAFGTAIWFFDNAVLYWIIYLLFFVACGWAARKGGQDGRKA